MKMATSFKTLISASLLMLAANAAQAVIINEAWTWYDPDLGLGEGEFTVINDSTTDIYAFAVANDAPAGSLPSAWDSSVAWEATLVSDTEWDAGIDMYFWDGASSSIVSTLDIGSFADLFPGYGSAFLYSYFTELSRAPIAAGTTERGFLFGAGLLGSPFVSIDFNGAIVDAHEAVHVSAVPLPAAVWLFGFGLGALGLLGRRRA